MAQISSSFGQYPLTRMRRRRTDNWCRNMVAETTLSVNDLILPLFIQEGQDQEDSIKSMPGISRVSVDLAVKRAAEAKALGIPAIALFPVIKPDLKTEDAKEAYRHDNLICTAVKAIKDAVSDLGIICDVALDPYTSHGHDGLLIKQHIVNDPTVEVLSKQALALAKAGCDIVAPSDMMDGRVSAIRTTLESAGYQNIKILSYAAKYASSLYGPFREAVGSSAALGTADKKTYQMDARNGREALQEVALDIHEGADMVLVKPGMLYLDIIGQLKEHFSVPILAYQVSGEYAMFKAAGLQHWLDADAALYESLISFKRAGASAIFTYAAIDIARTLQHSPS